MALTDLSKLNISFKKLAGKAQTDNAKEASNEAKPSGVTTSSSTIMGQDLPGSPSNTTLYDLTQNSLGQTVVEFVRLELVADPSSNGHAFFARLPSNYESSSSNPKSGSTPFTDGSVAVDSTGQLQIVPPLFGLTYEAKPYTGGTSAQGSGSLVPPGDPRDWNFDYFNGVFFQQDNVGAVPTHIECFIYVGEMGASGGSGSGSIKVRLNDAVVTTLPSGSSATIDGVSLVNDDLVLFTNLSSGNNKIYKAAGVGVGITWTAQNLYEGLSDAPSDGDAVRVTEGESFNEALMLFDGTDFISNDIIRFFDKETRVNFWELSSLKTLTLTQGTTDGEVFSVAFAGSENWIINYSLVRGSGKKRTGQLLLTTDGVDVSLTDTNVNIGTLGVSFSSDISGSNIRLLYTTDAGIDAEMKFFAHRWSNSGGGPSSLPSYTPTGGGVPAAGPVGSIQIHDSGGDLTGDANFKWDATENAINLGGLFIGGLEGPETLLDNQSTPQVIFSYPATDKISIIEYTIERGGEARAGKFTIVTNGSDVDEIDESVNTSPVGITLDAVLNGVNIDVRYASTSTGDTSSFKYYRKRWA